MIINYIMFFLVVMFVNDMLEEAFDSIYEWIMPRFHKPRKEGYVYIKIDFENKEDSKDD